MDKVEEPTVLFGKSKWIWTEDVEKKNCHVIFRRTFDFGQGKPPQRAFCRAACDSAYSLFVNGTPVVWCATSARSAKRAYYDEFDIARYLTKGDNVIVCFCEYSGTDGRDAVSSPEAGFIFECNDLGIYSDSTFEVYENVAFKTPAPSNCCYAGNGVNYDAALEGPIQNVLDPLYKFTQFKPAVAYGDYPDMAHGALNVRPVPLEKFSVQPVIVRPKKSTDQFDGDTYTINLPREMRITPYMEVTGNGQEKITIKTDRTDCMGCFGDEVSVYGAHSVEYLTKPTVNVYDGMLPMTGNVLRFTMPSSVKILKLGYRELSYATSPTTELRTDDEIIDTLYEKACNTLLCCMGSTLMDNPERDRCMWLGDASIEARALYLSFADAAPLVKKLLDDVIDHSDDGVLYSCVPGNVPADMPSHGLLALSEYGIFAAYRNFTADIDFFRANFEKLCDYLMLWEMTEHGVELRDGARRWYDNLYNIDGALIENALYYSACRFMLGIGEAVGFHDYDETFIDRTDNIAAYIESAWDGVGYTTTEDFYDDRANSFITLAGLVPDDRVPAVARLIAATENASPYTDWAAVEALCKLGRGDLARRRFDSRNALDVKSEYTTLGEDYAGFGVGCQGYRSAIVFEQIQLFGGVEIKDGASRIKIAPDFRALKDMRLTLELCSGSLEVRYKYSPARSDIFIDNRTNAKVELEISPERVGHAAEHRTIVLNKGKNKFAI